MTRRAQGYGRPADWVHGDFPDGPLRPDAPVPAATARAVAVAARDALATRSLSALCRDTGLSRSTVQDLLAGRHWPDLVTVAVLEDALGTRLWPLRD